MDSPAEVLDAAEARPVRVAEEPGDGGESRNFLALALYQVLLRIGWIFKTESIIMPAFLDLVGGSGVLRGCLPVLNRLGHSVPPVLYARRLAALPVKRRVLLRTTAVMATCFLSLAALNWLATRDDARGVAGWLKYAFLAVYVLFFSANGINLLALNTLTGKLIRATRRGRLLLVATCAGAALAILSAWLLLDRWLALKHFGFMCIFGFTGAVFALAAASTTLLAEPADDADRSPDLGDGMPAGRLAAGRFLLQHDRNFRRLVYVAVLFSTVLIVFPHFQALAATRLGDDYLLSHLMVWVCVQNAGAGVFSLIIGPLGDRYGYRLVLKVCIFCVALAPVLAVWLLAGDDAAWGRGLYWLVFLPLGMTPVTVKGISNYTLEISDRQRHPQYLSTLSLCTGLPFLIAPLVGWLVDRVGFEHVFLAAAGLMACGGLLAFRLVEPRHHCIGEMVMPDEPES